MIDRRRSTYYYIIIATAFFLLSFISCKTYKQKDDELPDTMNRGKLYVSADESFKPVIDEMVKVYESNHPDTKIFVQYKPEADCFKDLLIDSIKLIIGTRTFHEDERKFIVDSLKVAPEYMTIARDGIAVIVNSQSPDTAMNMVDIRAILENKFTKNLIPVFDGVKATSTVRFIIDSVLRGAPLTPTAVAARSSLGVIDYVSKNPGYIGFIGVSWIGNPEDTAELGYLKKVKMVGIESTDIPKYYVKAYQANIYIKRYPMVRDLVYILKEKYEGLGNGFADFMSGEKGQLIFRRAYLAPAQKNFAFRPVRLRE